MTGTATTMFELLEEAHQRGASDLILSSGSPPMVYCHGLMQPMNEQRFTSTDLDQILLECLDTRQRDNLQENRDLDYSIGRPGIGRCRVNIHFQRGALAAAVRFIPDEIPNLASLRLPSITERVCDLPRGLVLVTGGTGEGKSTTLAAMVDRINHLRALHVITLEDPIEYAFRNDKSVIEQREIGRDSPSFGAALRHVVRQKPNVILIGELRDLETISAALTAAETGHLVMASLHTVSASQTIERIVDVFDSHRQPQVRLQLANTLRVIICQTLLRNRRDGGMVPACEVLVNNTAVAAAIRENKVHLINGMIETGSSHAMQLLDAALASLVAEGLVTREDALSRAADIKRLERLLERRGPAETAGRAAKNKKPWE